jgi:hypothetical protein
MRKRALLGLLGFVALAACETPYQDRGFSGGVQATRFDAT